MSYSTLKPELAELLFVQPSDIWGILDELTLDNRIDNDDLQVNFYYIRFQNKTPRIDAFISMICDYSVTYCVRRDKLNVSAAKYRKIVLEAKKKFVNPPPQGRTGEPGEVVVFFMLDGILRAPKVLTKMSLKTNPQMHVHGADGVHLGIDRSGLILYFGESKLYKNFSDAITEALKSIKQFRHSKTGSTLDTQQEYEISLLSDNLDIPEGELRRIVIEALNPYGSGRDNLNYVYTCFIGFDLNCIAGSCDFNQFKTSCEEKARICFRNVTNSISTDSDLKSLNWRFFFLPFASVEEFRNRFVEEINK